MEYIAAEAESPIEKGDFLSFTKREAEIYFNWYIEHIDERIEYLCEYVHSQGQSIELDFSVNSIIEIWDWYVKQIKIERYTRSELEEIAKEYDVTYPTVRLRLDRLIQKIKVCDEMDNDPYIALVKRFAVDEKIDFDTAKRLIAEYKKQVEKGGK